VAPLLTTAGGQKMGKTAGGAVWLDAGRTSPFLYFQHWLGTADEDVGRFLGLFTELEMPEVRRLAGRSGADRREAKAVLAFEAARLAHGEDAAQEAREASRSLFGGRGDPEASAPACAVTAAEAAAGLPAADLLVRAGFAPSRAAARRLIAQGGMRLGGERVEDPAARLDGKQLRDGALLWAGHKRVCRLCVDLGPAWEA
jgi:tyrosyl-tRNA synthetase